MPAEVARGVARSVMLSHLRCMPAELPAVLHVELPAEFPVELPTRR